VHWLLTGVPAICSSGGNIETELRQIKLLLARMVVRESSLRHQSSPARYAEDANLQASLPRVF
jgi:hypothetical protein